MVVAKRGQRLHVWLTGTRLPQASNFYMRVAYTAPYRALFHCYSVSFSFFASADRTKRLQQAFRFPACNQQRRTVATIFDSTRVTIRNHDIRPSLPNPISRADIIPTKKFRTINKPSIRLFAASAFLTYCTCIYALFCPRTVSHRGSDASIPMPSSDSITTYAYASLSTPSRLARLAMLLYCYKAISKKI